MRNATAGTRSLNNIDTCTSEATFVIVDYNKMERVSFQVGCSEYQWNRWKILLHVYDRYFPNVLCSGFYNDGFVVVQRGVIFDDWWLNFIYHNNVEWNIFLLAEMRFESVGIDDED